MRTIAILVVLLLANISNAHWTYPGDLATHLRQTHGIQTAGMSRQQMLYLHDSLHESTRSYQYRTGPLRRLFRR